MKNLKSSAVATVLLVVMIGTANAADAIDLTAITGSFSASDVITAVMAVAGTLASIYATMTAAKMALRWIRGG